MNLKKYKAMRRLGDSKEPAESTKEDSSALRFCVQEHHARSHHYDVRLECRGVLLSWAVPKGPSLNPQDKRLAVHVEDHPLDYQYFEGIIPKENYGAGTVAIWDHGFFTTPHSTDREEIEKALVQGLKNGHIVVVLHGEKLNGTFLFQKLKKEKSDNSWLLIKQKDLHAKPGKSSTTKAKDKLPKSIPVMLATLIKQPFDSDEWLFEIKWDGFRAISFIERGKVQLKSRNGLLLNRKFPSLVKELEEYRGTAILDGEIVSLDSKGKSHFQWLQNDQEKEGFLCYYVFDLLYREGQDLRHLPLVERKTLLKAYLQQLKLPSIFYSDHILKKGKAFFKEAMKANLEGIIGKNIHSQYQGKRSPNWVKIKIHFEQEVIICGFTEPKGSRARFGALIGGVYNEKNELLYVGHIGGGFSHDLLEMIYQRLKPLVIKKCPFQMAPKTNAQATWVKPKLVAQVSFTEWTKDNRIRHPIFLGLRIDKEAPSVKKEIPKKDYLSLTHVDKVYWPKENYTKGDLLHYYETIASYILPHLKNRPIVLHRFPDGIEGADFYQKDLNFSLPKGIKTVPIQHKTKIDHYLLIHSLKSLLFAINLGSIDLHPFLSRQNQLDRPDFCVIDLDPHGVSFDKVIEAALVTHEILEGAGVKHYCKTSGGNGLHIVIPFHAKYTFEQSRQFAELICAIVHQKLPKTTSMLRSSLKRPKKIYLDYLQNRIAQSIVAPYVVRPRPKALVSTPLLWEEVNEHLDVSKYTMETVISRLKKMGDIFKPVLGAGIDLKKALSKI